MNVQRGLRQPYVASWWSARITSGGAWAQMLMNAAEDWALRHLTLDSGAANGPARAFYASRGYREEDVRLAKALGRSL
jgi:GNAT superfamily N-acetyltransferase